MYSINFTVTKKKFCFSLHYNGANSYLFVNGTEIYKFKAKDSEIVASPLCLGNISKDWSTDNMKKKAGLTILSNFTNALNCISMKNEERKTRPHIININSNNPISYPFGIKINKYSGNCNNINNSFAKFCVPDVVKDLNVKVFNPMSRTNETRFIKWHEKYKCKCRLHAMVCSNKQCRCECKELIDKGICDKGFSWNPSNCECECDKNCDFNEYLDYENRR